MRPVHILRGVLDYVRDVVGESDYERYLDHHVRAGHAGDPLTRKEWFRRRTLERYEGGGPTRCC